MEVFCYPPISHLYPYGDGPKKLAVAASPQGPEGGPKQLRVAGAKRPSASAAGARSEAEIKTQTVVPCVPQMCLGMVEECKKWDNGRDGSTDHGIFACCGCWLLNPARAAELNNQPRHVVHLDVSENASHLQVTPSYTWHLLGANAG